MLIPVASPVVLECESPQKSPMTRLFDPAEFLMLSRLPGRRHPIHIAKHEATNRFVVLRHAASARYVSVEFCLIKYQISD